MRSAFKFGFLVFVIAALAGVSWLIWQQLNTGGNNNERDNDDSASVAVEIAPIEHRVMRELRTLSGTLQPRARSLIAPKISGRVDELNVDIGDQVEHGQVVATLEADEFVQALEETRAELEVARANLAESRNALEIAQREFERIRQLYERGVTSESELDAIRADLEARKAQEQVGIAQVARREAQVRGAEVRLSYATIRASWSNPNGPRVIGERFVDDGSTVSANEPIVSALDIDTLRAIVHVAERDYARLSVGQMAIVHSDSYPDESFEGRIERLSPEFREASRQARVEVRIDNPSQKLKPGMFVRVVVELDRVDEARVVPRQALVRREGREGVFIVDRDGTEPIASFIPVRTGIVQGGAVQVIEPSITGEVVMLGQHLLDDGSPLRVVEEHDAIPAAGPASRDSELTGESES